MFLPRHGGTTLDGRLDRAQAGGMVNEPESDAHSIGSGGVATNIEGDDGSEAPQLVACDRVRWMGGEPRIPNACDARVCLQSLCELHRIRLRALETKRHRARASRCEECLEGTGGRAAQLARAPQGITQVLTPNGHHPGEQVGVTADELGRRLERDVSPEVKWSLVHRCRECVVDRQQRGGFSRCGADGTHVGDGQEWIRRRLQPDEVRVRARAHPCTRVVHR
jgi:hypothetical protein